MEASLKIAKKLSKEIFSSKETYIVRIDPIKQEYQNVIITVYFSHDPAIAYRWTIKNYQHTGRICYHIFWKLFFLKRLAKII